MSTPTPLIDLTIERDFLSRLVDLLDSDSPAPLVEETLALLKMRAGAARAFLEIRDSDGRSPGFRASFGFDGGALSSLREVMTHGSLAATLASGRSIVTAARPDPPHDRRPFLCVPVGAPPFGVICLEGHEADARFPPLALAWTERFARHLRPVARRLLAASPPHLDETASARARLDGTERLVGQSAALAMVLKMAASVAPLDVPVLLTGPSGTGKSELARVIARSSPRRDRPFVALNCAAIPDELLESELFGAHAGAHSTATRKIPGKVELAAGGTLFLDEIAELSLSAQAKLLQLLQERTFWPLGAPRVYQADVRVIAATNTQLARRVADGRFREDLFYRLDVMLIEMPGLDARRTDIPLMAEHFLEDARERHGLGALELSLATRHALTVAQWPGHVRQLANTVLGAAIRAHSERSTTIEPHHAFPDRKAPLEAGATWHEAMRETQKRLLEGALEASHGTVSEAARRLGIARSYVYELIKELGVRAR